MPFRDGATSSFNEAPSRQNSSYGFETERTRTKRSTVAFVRSVAAANPILIAAIRLARGVERHPFVLRRVIPRSCAAACALPVDSAGREQCHNWPLLLLNLPDRFFRAHNEPTRNEILRRRVEGACPASQIREPFGRRLVPDRHHGSRRRLMNITFPQ